MTIIPYVFGITEPGPENVVFVTTLEDVPQSPVGNISVSNLSSSSVSLKWNPPSVPNGLITKYVAIVEPSLQRKTVDGEKLPIEF